MKYTGAYEGTALGTITLCQDCGFAIQLRRRLLRGKPSETLGEYDCWVHFRIPITPHVGRPMRRWSDYDCYGNPT